VEKGLNAQYSNGKSQKKGKGVKTGGVMGKGKGYKRATATDYQPGKESAVAWGKKKKREIPTREKEKIETLCSVRKRKISLPKGGPAPTSDWSIEAPLVWFRGGEGGAFRVSEGFAHCHRGNGGAMS